MTPWWIEEADKLLEAPKPDWGPSSKGMSYHKGPTNRREGEGPPLVGRDTDGSTFDADGLKAGSKAGKKK